MTYVLMDIGNTTLKWCFLGQENEIHHVTVEALLLQSARDDLVSRLQEAGTKKVSLCSVARKEISLPLIETFINKDISVIQVHSQKEYKGSFELLNLYQKPNTLGSDRWYSAIGAINTIPCRSLVVVNFGTATVIDSVIYRGGNNYEFVGGRILPGVEITEKAFIDKLGHIADFLAGKLDLESEIDFPKNTLQAISTGFIEAQVGAITLVMDKMQSMGYKPALIISGGWAPKFKQTLQKQFPEISFIANTVLTGLATVLTEEKTL